MWNLFKMKQELSKKTDPLLPVREAYLKNRYEDALSHLQKIEEAYRAIPKLDDKTLLQRGLPNFSRWWGYSAALALLMCKMADLEKTTQFFLERGGSEQSCDFEELKAKLAVYQNHQLGSLLAFYEKRLEAMPAAQARGYVQMHIATLKSLSAKTFVEAKQFLTDVVLTPKDAPWLEDVRTLSLAYLAGRTKNTRMEEERIKEFLPKQPQLLEPDIALSFYLLKYQELLKPRVQAGDLK